MSYYDDNEQWIIAHDGFVHDRLPTRHQLKSRLRKEVNLQIKEYALATPEKKPELWKVLMLSLDQLQKGYELDPEMA